MESENRGLSAAQGIQVRDGRNASEREKRGGER